ncbi:acyltransferase [Erwinia rhapontici]|uniref:DapH/DapD/GlmU-related protein n=1 Tax=Erwinia rhapontici TaxID=55212 RepID=UPI0014382FB7|nr:DapH/DapD/GlmU-related protein [Erwinia rhapontici]NKG29776.1 acyltransferase [Erwinia rhapontici]
MSKIKRERLGMISLRVIPFFYNFLRNRTYSMIFNAKNIKVGHGLSISGSKNIFIGENVYLGNNSWLDSIGDGVIYIGDNVSCSQNVHIAAQSTVKIGNGALIGSDVLITDHDHKFGKCFENIIPKKRGLTVKGNTEIGENVWLGDNVKVLSGVTLGKNVVVAANSVVTKSFSAGLVIGGIPARILEKKSNNSHGLI